MGVAVTGKDMVMRELRQGVERLHDDIARVEFWTDALGSFSKLVPDYDPSGTRLNQYILPCRKVEDALDKVRDSLEIEPRGKG